MAMFKKNNRLTKDKDFITVFKKGRSSYDKNLGIKIVYNNLEETRFAVIVSKKVSKIAVKRNRIKRQVRAIILEDLAKIKSGYDVAVICLPEIVDKDFSQIKESIITNINNLKLYK